METLTAASRYSAADMSSICYALFDIDNTLVGNESHDAPSQRFCDAVKKVQAQGVKIGVATARPLQKVQHVIDAAGLQGVCILSNGAQIFDPSAQMMVEEMTIDGGAVQEILAELRAENVVHWVQDDGEDHFWVGNSAESRARYSDSLETYEKSSDPWSMPTAETAVAIDAYVPNRPFVIVARGVARPIVAKLEDLGLRYAAQNVAVLTAHETTDDSGEAVYDVFLVHTHGNKKDALPKACAAAGATVDQTMMTGDGLNDVVILEQTGVAVAVANAHPDAKAVATHLAPSWYDDGAAIAIEELLIASKEVS